MIDLFNFPRSFIIIFFVLLLAAASLALVQGLLVLYSVNHLGFHDKDAYDLYAAFISLLFATPVVSGYINGRLLGYPLSILMSFSLATIGIYIICLGTITFLYFGLAAFMVGLSSGITSLYLLLSRIFTSLDYRREGAFTLCYTSMNLGGFFILVASGFIVVHWGYQNAFLIAAVLLLLALLLFILNIRFFLKPSLEFASENKLSSFNKVYPPILGLLGLIGMVPISAELFYYAEMSSKVLFALTLIATLMLILFCWKINTQQRKRILVFSLLLVISLSFWSLDLLTPSLLTLFTLRNVDRVLLNFIIPPSDFISLNPLFVMTLGFVFSSIWMYLNKHNRSPSLPVKFTIGISLMAISYFVLSLSTHFANHNGLIGTKWIIASYFLQACSELFIFPIGTAMIGTLIPRQYEGIMMGLWFLSIGLGGAFSGYLADTTTSPKNRIAPLTTNPIYGHSFLCFAILALLVAVIAGLMAPYLKRIIRESNLI